MPKNDLSWDDAHRRLVPLMKPDNRTNIGFIAREYLFLAVVLSGCHMLMATRSTDSLSTGLFAPLAMLGVLLVAIGQHRLSGLAHDASHQVLFRNKLANELVSDLLLMFPIVAMTQKYRAAHLGHHQFVNDPARDPDLMRLNHPDPQHFPITKSGFWHRYVVLGLWPPSILRYLFGRAKAANLGVDGSKTLRGVYSVRVARCMRGAYWLSLLSAVHLSGSWATFGLFWIVPLLTAYPILMQLREIAHHSNAPDDGDLTNSRVFLINPLLSAAIFPYGQAFHLTHHLFAMVPHYRVARAHEILGEHVPYRDSVVVCRGYFFRTLGTQGPSVLDVLSRPRGGAIRRPYLSAARGLHAKN
ncbi:fatty acid desaturase [Isosphaeraceae bacterium EP7]